MLAFQRSHDQAINLLLDQIGARSLLRLVKSALSESPFTVPVEIGAHVFRKPKRITDYAGELRVERVGDADDESIILRDGTVILRLNTEDLEYLTYHLEKYEQLPSHYILPEFTSVWVGPGRQNDLYIITQV